MSKTLHVSLLLAGSATFMYSCTKIDNNIVNAEAELLKPRKPVSVCQDLSFTYKGLPDGATTTTFLKSFDPATGRPSRIQVGVAEGGTIVETVYFNIKWLRNQVAFIADGSPTDTVLVAAVDNKGLVTSVRQGNAPNFEFLPTRFQYKENRVSVMTINLNGTSFVSRFTYDNNGNCVKIQDDAKNGQTGGRVDYKYDLTKKATQQSYRDEARGFSWNTYSLLEYVGLIPGDRPTNLRTRTTVTWEDNYVVYDFKLVNHKMDAQGKLISYDVANPVSGEVYITNNIEWACGGPTTQSIQ